MVILNIKLLSGFVSDSASLATVSYNCNRGRNRNIQTVFIDLWWTGWLSIISSQLTGPKSANRVDVKDDHILIYIQQVRWFSSNKQCMLLLLLELILSSALPPIVTERAETGTELRSYPGAPCGEPEASCGWDLWLLRSK